MGVVAFTDPAFGFDLRLSDLYDRAGLTRLDDLFLGQLPDDLRDRLTTARTLPPGDFPGGPKAEADFLVALAPHLERFVAKLFGITAEMSALSDRQADLAPLYDCKRLFVQRRAAKALTPDQLAALDSDALTGEITALLGADWSELDFARTVMGWLADEPAHAEDLGIAARYAAWALLSEAGRAKHRPGVLFKAPAKHDPLRRVDYQTVRQDGVTKFVYAPDRLRHREGFALTDCGVDLTGGLDEVSYCILCHHQGKDSCSKGLHDKQTGAYTKTAVGAKQTGCPLEERISEMHEVKGMGLPVAALAVAVVDNPMVAGTGHRICNDCMTACVYTNGNRAPVNVPEAETRVLKDVLDLPWGFEVYSLLTRWNPLNLRRPLPLPPTGRTVLVAGMGPAGYTLAHHLLNDGHAVVAIDGLKIEPLPPSLSGIGLDGGRVPFRAIRDVAELFEHLGERVNAGFGGVAEYGITVRWNKNFLKIIRLLLERRSDFLMAGGVRLGSAVTLESAFAAGFDHIALCMGAGKPTVIDMPNNLARGVRQASDFLMALQLTGAARKASLANLQLRLPVVVIGGGLTAIDACTEALAYYPIQVEKYLSRYETLAAEQGEAAVRARLTPEDAEIADEFLAHGRAIRAERVLAAQQSRAPDILGLLNQWGGATIAYRRSLLESPAYRNHEEVHKAMEEGIRFAEKLTPVAVEVDQYGAAKALRVKGPDGEVSLPARAVIVAAGTVPNTVLAREDKRIRLHGKYFEAIGENGQPVEPETVTKPATPTVLMSLDGEGPALSFHGDLHPSWAGNVVSAMASAKLGYPIISRRLTHAGKPKSTPETLFAWVNKALRPRVHAVKRLCPTIVEVTIEAPAAAQAFLPGQFYRLQNYEENAARTADTVLATEGLALTGAWVDRQAGLVSLIVLEMGGSSDLCAVLKPGEQVVLMGPTGSPTETPAGENVLLAGGGLGNAVLFSIGQALRRAGSRVLYFAGYKQAADLFKVAEIEAAADVIVWCVDGGDPLPARRPQDKSFVGNIVQAMQAYGEGKFGAPLIDLKTIDRIVAIGSDRMMQAVAQARHGVLEPMLKPGHHAIGSINSPMQCMMKEICAQCLQKHRDPATGQEFVVFTCANQDQPLDWVDFKGLHERLGQNAVQEKLTRLWIDRALHQLALRT